MSEERKRTLFAVNTYPFRATRSTNQRRSLKRGLGLFGKAQPYRTDSGKAAGDKGLINFIVIGALCEDAAFSNAL